MTATEFIALTDAMKSRGVKSFAMGDMSVDFAAPEVALPKTEKKVDDEKCRCGHHLLDEHQNGLCIRNCDPLTCSPEPAK